jgi:L-threonylcarbamoyladenylate synthase
VPGSTGVPPGEASPDADGSNLERAAAVLAAGSIVAIPTDTVYGLAVDPRRPGATDALFAAKLRPATLELPVLVASIDQADRLAGPAGLSSMARRLVGRFWPGSLTIVVPRHGDVDWILGGDGRTIGLRCPADSFARRLCDTVGPLATTSANRHGEPPITSASELTEEFGDEVALIVDGGLCDGAPSTVIDVTGAELRCIRDGAVPWTEIQKFVSSD